MAATADCTRVKFWWALVPLVGIASSCRSSLDVARDECRRVALDAPLSTLAPSAAGCFFHKGFATEVAGPATDIEACRVSCLTTSPSGSGTCPGTAHDCRTKMSQCDEPCKDVDTKAVGPGGSDPNGPVGGVCCVFARNDKVLARWFLVE